MILYFLVLLIFESTLVIMSCTNKDSGFLKKSFGVFLGIILSLILYFIYAYTDVFSYDTGEWVTLRAVVISIIFAIANIIIGIISFILYKTLKNKYGDTSRKKDILKYFAIISIISFVIIGGQFSFKTVTKIKIDNEIKLETIKYLKSKYGTDDFIIEKIDRDFADNGFISTDSLENYNIKVIYRAKDIKFNVYLDVDDDRNLLVDSFNDYFMYYTYCDFDEFKDNAFETSIETTIDDLNIYLKEKGLNVLVDDYSRYTFFNESKFAVPYNYGAIPTKEELYDMILDYHIKHEFKIVIDSSEVDSSNLKVNIKNYLVKLSNILNDYYHGIDDYHVYCSYKNGNDFFNGDLYITRDYINIDGNLFKEKIKR